jgi:hypothetical protein
MPQRFRDPPVPSLERRRGEGAGVRGRGDCNGVGILRIRRADPCAGVEHEADKAAGCDGGPRRCTRLAAPPRDATHQPGQGIREADQEALFQAFREIKEPSGRRIGGLGLGLSVARELILAHGGDVWCESVVGKGTTFSVAIPLDPDAASARPVRAKR